MKSFVACLGLVALPAQAHIVVSPGADLALFQSSDSLSDLEEKMNRLLNSRNRQFSIQANEQQIDYRLERVLNLACTEASPDEAAFSIVRNLQALTDPNLVPDFPTDLADKARSSFGGLLEPGEFEYCEGSYFEDSPYNGEDTKYILLKREGNDVLLSFSHHWN